MSLWKWKEVELEVDMEDVDFQEKYEDAFNAMAKTENVLQNIGKLSDFTRKYCEMFFKLFDDIFGEGTSEKLFNGKCNTRLVEECYDSFIDFCTKEVNKANKRKATLAKKYKVKSKK